MLACGPAPGAGSPAPARRERPRPLPRGPRSRPVLEPWLAVPATQRLHPPFPGAVVDDARFLDGGEALALTVRFPPDPGREAWRFRLPPPAAPGRGLPGTASGPPSRSPPSASPPGDRVAYLATGPAASGASAAPGPPGRAAPAGGRAVGRPPDEVWVSGRARRARRAALLPPPGRPRPPAGLLLVARTGGTSSSSASAPSPAAPGGPACSGSTPARRRSTVRWLPAERPPRPSAAGGGEGAARELATLPADVVPGSYTWSPGGDRVALLTRAGEVTAVGVVDTAPTAGLAFTYVADLDRGAAAGWAPAPPIPRPARRGAARAHPPGRCPPVLVAGRAHAWSSPPARRPARRGRPAPLAALTGPGRLPDLYLAHLRRRPAPRRPCAAGAGGDRPRLAPGREPRRPHPGAPGRPAGPAPLPPRRTGAGDLPLAALPSGATYRARWDGGRPAGPPRRRPSAPATRGAPGQVEYWLVRFGPLDAGGPGRRHRPAPVPPRPGPAGGTPGPGRRRRPRRPDRAARDPPDARARAPAGALPPRLGWPRLLLGALIRGSPCAWRLRLGLGAAPGGPPGGRAAPGAARRAARPPGCCPAAPVHAQEAPGGAGARPAPPAGSGGRRRWADLARAVGDVLGGVRTITETTTAISDAARTVADFVARVAD